MFALMLRFSKYAVLCACIFLAPGVILRAEVLLLEDDSVIEGTIVSEDAVYVTVRTATASRKIAKEDIREILYEFSTAEERVAAVEDLKASRQSIDEQMVRIMTRGELEAFLIAERNRLNAGREPDAAETPRDTEPAPPADEGPAGGVVWRSAVLPGWGQMHAGRDRAGQAFLISSLVVAALFYANHRDVVRLNAEFAAAAERTQALSFAGALTASAAPAALAYIEERRIFDRRLNVSRDRQNLSLLLLGLYAWNLIDAANTTASPHSAGTRAGWAFNVEAVAGRRSTNLYGTDTYGEIRHRWSF